MSRYLRGLPRFSIPIVRAIASTLPRLHSISHQSPRWRLPHPSHPLCMPSPTARIPCARSCHAPNAPAAHATCCYVAQCRNRPAPPCAVSVLYPLCSCTYKYSPQSRATPPRHRPTRRVHTLARHSCIVFTCCPVPNGTAAMVAIAQLVEHLIVVQKVARSSRVSHPINPGLSFDGSRGFLLRHAGRRRTRPPPEGIAPCPPRSPCAAIHALPRPSR